MKRTRSRVPGPFVRGAVALAAVAALSACSWVGATSTVSSPSHGAAPKQAPLFTTEQAIARVQQDTAEFSGPVTAKTMTIGALRKSKQFDPGPATSSRKQVIVAVADGRFVPEFGHGHEFPWGALVFDRATGNVLGTFSTSGAIPAVLKP